MTSHMGFIRSDAGKSRITRTEPVWFEIKDRVEFECVLRDGVKSTTCLNNG